METSFKLAVGALLAIGGALGSSPARASDRDCDPVYEIEADVDPDAGTLSGRITVRPACTGEAPDRILLWLYPNVLAKPPASLDAMNTYWIYPHHFRPAGMRVHDVAVDGVAQTQPPEPVQLPADHPLASAPGVLVAIVLPPGSGPDSVIGMSFEVDVPERYGLFGKARKGMLLASYWHPVMAARSGGEWDLDSPPAPAHVAAALRLPGGMDAMLGGDLVADADPEGMHVVDARTRFTIPLAVYPELETSEASCGGVRIAFHGLDPRPPHSDYEPGTGEVLGITPTIPDIMSLDRPWHAMEVACRTVELLAELGRAQPAGTRLELVEAPLRLELASSTEGFVVVSDRMFDILPVRKAWKFHEFQLVRAIAGHLVGRDIPLDVQTGTAVTSADFVASSVVGLYAERWHGTQEDIREILKYGAFLAAIDYFIYSPLVEFREAYFSTVAEKDWLRDEPWAFLDRLPRGKLYHEKLVDLVGQQAVRDVVKGFLAKKGSLRDLASAAAGEDLGWFFDQWSVTYPSLNYRVNAVRTTRLDDGTFSHEADVERQGDTSIREPVTVRFVMKDGTRVDRVWDEAGAGATIELRSPSKLDRVVVDPMMRLFEDPSLTANHPYYDNFSRPMWRPPVFTTLALTSNITNLSGDLDIIFDMRPKFDVLDAIRFRILLTTWGQGGSVWYTRGFGEKLDLNSSSWHVGAVLSGFHHSAPYGFAHEREDGSQGWKGGTSLSAGLYVSHDDRFYLFNPTSGWSWWLRVGYGLGVDDPIDGVKRGLRHSVSVSTRGFGLWTPSGGHTLALYGGAGGTFGDAYRGQLGSLSSHDVLRGFDADETFGKVRLYLCAEYRHMFTQALNWNILHYVTVQGIQGVLFAGAGTVTREDSYHGLFAAQRIFTEVGYGLRAILGYFGAYPGILALDLAVPITPVHRPGRLPVALRLAFNHVF